MLLRSGRNPPVSPRYPRLVPDSSLDATTTRRPWWALVLACVVWLALWPLTPGLLARGPGSLVTDDPSAVVLIESAIALVVILVLLLLHRRYARALFAPSWQLALYALPVGLAIALPFHYGLPLPVGVYMAWMTVSVFWQDTLTFGLLQSHLAERLPTWAVVAIVAVVFYAGHAVLIPDRFAPWHVLPALGILGLGVVLALLRARLKTLHLILALHLAFYFVFA